MVALLWRTGWFDLVVVVDKLGIVLVGVAAEEAIVTLETSPERPAVVGTGGADLLRRGEMPLADCIGAVAVFSQHLGQEAVLERDGPIVSGVAGGDLGDGGHPVRVVVTPGQNTRARWRAERRRMHVCVEQAILRQAVDIGRPDWRTVAAELAEPCVVQHDEQHVRRSLLLRPSRLRPGRRGLIYRRADNAGERASGPVLVQRHCTTSSSVGLRVITGLCSAGAGSPRRRRRAPRTLSRCERPARKLHGQRAAAQ